MKKTFVELFCDRHPDLRIYVKSMKEDLDYLERELETYKEEVGELVAIIRRRNKKPYLTEDEELEYLLDKYELY